jgi:hypothetical protein
VILGFIISKKSKLFYPKKIHAIVNMHLPHNSLHIQIFNGMAQFYKCFINTFAMVMVPIIKLPRKTKRFLWIEECIKAWELIKYKYIETSILIPQIGMWGSTFTRMHHYLLWELYWHKIHREE